MAHLELAQDPFDVDEFVERLAWRANQSASDHGTSFDPMVLHGAFCQTIQQLMEHERKLEKQSKHLEKECIEEEIKQRCKVKDLLRENQVRCVNICLFIFTCSLRLIESLHH